MTSAPSAAQFRKAAASSPQQACVMVYRDEYRTLLWDDKLAVSADAAVPSGQCLVFGHEQFEAIQAALRTGAPLPPWLRIRRRDGHYEFSAPARYTAAVGSARLRFDEREYSAFVEAVRDHEFARSAFPVRAA